ncbi:MAG: hypothetical protein ACOYNL_02230 [Rickettsiales bacterium]
MDDAKNIKLALRDAVTRGDLRKVKYLAGQFPDTFRHQENEYEFKENLVDLAATHGRNDIAIYLILEHGFEVSPNYEYERKQFKGGEYIITGGFEYLQTMEVLANAVLTTRNMRPATMHAMCCAIGSTK